VLTINGAPVGRELGKFYLKEQLEGRRTGQNNPAQNPAGGILRTDKADGSIMMIVATDAPMDHRNLKRLAERAMVGLGRTGSSASNGSGDYVIAFSTAKQNRIRASETLRSVQTVGNDAMSPLFQAVAEATEEAIYNSLFRATAITGRDGNRVEALPIEKTVEILKKYNAVK
jgi:D-aminopeptidase